MAAARPAAGGGRWLEVDPGRFARWVDGFGERHGGVQAVERGADAVVFRGADGAIAECHVPFPPMAAPGAGEPGGEPGGGEGGEERGGEERGGAADRAAGAAAELAAHVAADRLVGVILVRLGGYAIGAFAGERLVASKVGSRQVHGRSSTGGWSQQRFARRRDKQAREAVAAAADTTARVLGPYERRLDAVVLGGDRRAVDALRDDARLAPLFALAVDRFLSVPDPRLAILREAPRHFRAVRIRLVDPGGLSPPGSRAAS